MLRYHRTYLQRKTADPVKIFVAANDVTTRTITSFLRNRRYEPLITSNLDEMCAAQQAGPSLVFMDGMTEGRGIPDACRRIRLSLPKGMAYIVLVLPGSEMVKTDLDIPHAPDDILTSPFTQRDIDARVSVGMRVIELESELSARVVDLTHAERRIQKLSGLLPICSHCKKIRDDRGYWNELEKYISDHSDAEFSHAICPGCLKTYYPDVKDEPL